MRILIIGATGLVGQALWRDWSGRTDWKVAGTFHARPCPGMEPLDICDANALRSVLRSVDPDVVALAAANPHVDYCEQHPEETRRINVDATLQVARAAIGAKKRFVFFSSDYVFDGTRAPYVETDAVAPINEYGRQKVQVERGIADLGPNHLIVRISGVFGWEESRKNFVLQLLDRAAAKTPIRAAIDLRYHPTYAPNIASVLSELVDSGAQGIFHVSGPKELSRYEFAQEIAKAFNVDVKLIQAMRIADAKDGTRRPPNSSMESRKMPSELANRLWEPQRALEDMRRRAEQVKA